MRSRIIGIVLIVVSIGINVWLGTGLATGSRATGIGLGFVLFSLPFLAVGIYLLLSARGEIKEESKADKERNILDAVMTRGKVTVADLAIEGNLTRDQVKGYVYDLIGKDLFRGYVNWNRGELVSAEAGLRSKTAPVLIAVAAWSWQVKVLSVVRIVAPRYTCRGRGRRPRRPPGLRVPRRLRPPARLRPPGHRRLSPGLQTQAQRRLSPLLRIRGRLRPQPHLPPVISPPARLHTEVVREARLQDLAGLQGSSLRLGTGAAPRRCRAHGVAAQSGR